MAKTKPAAAPAAKVETPVTASEPVVETPTAEPPVAEAAAPQPDVVALVQEPAQEPAAAPAAKVAEQAFSVPAGFTPIEYIGRRTPHTDGLYGTRIEWNVVGAVRLVPDDVAAKMVKVNRDVYRIGTYGGETLPALQSAKPIEDNARLELDIVIQTMDKDALEAYARTHFRQELDKRRSVETLRQEVGRMIDQFGAP
jgi:hypothetical protein